MRLTDIVAFAALGWAAGSRAQQPTPAGAEMVGMSKAQVLGCAAWPARSQASDDTEVFTFLAQDASPADGAAHPAAGPKRRYCTATLILRHGAVEKVQYATRSRTMMIRGDHCAYAVDGCSR